MKPYGLKVIEYPDVADIQEMGAKSSTGKSGDYHPYARSERKRQTRRYWKRRARAAAKLQIENAENAGYCRSRVKACIRLLGNSIIKGERP